MKKKFVAQNIYYLIISLGKICKTNHKWSSNCLFVSPVKSGNFETFSYKKHILNKRQAKLGFLKVKRNFKTPPLFIRNP
jgi:hypothetical protein